MKGGLLDESCLSHEGDCLLHEGDLLDDIRRLWHQVDHWQWCRLWLGRNLNRTSLLHLGLRLKCEHNGCGSKSTNYETGDNPGPWEGTMINFWWACVLNELPGDHNPITVLFLARACVKVVRSVLDPASRILYLFIMLMVAKLPNCAC